MPKLRQPTSRRKVISGIGAGALVATAGFGNMSRAASNRPNILIIMSDQEMAPRYLTAVNRPNHARLRKNGLTFNHSYVSNPVCSPSRAALFTGLYPWENGVIGNVDIYQDAPELDPKIPTIGSVFAAQGYTTGFFGKWHLNWLVEDPILLGSDYDGSRRDQLQQYGFQTSFIPTDSDDRPLGKRWDGEIARQAGAWLRTAQLQPQPWLAVVSLINPHDIPFTGLYDDRPMPDYAITMPKSWNEDLMAEGIPRSMRRSPPQRAGKRNQFPGAFGVPPETEAEWREYIRRYYYLLEDCDRNVGTVMDALEQTGGLDNTTIVYTTDHGEMASAHGRTGKGVMYEEAVSVPLIISNPKRFKTPQVTDALANNIDVAPTIAAIAGIKWPRALRGIDLLRDKQEAIFSVAGQSTDLKGLVKMVRANEWKLILYPNGDMQLFDMKNDIDELNNRAKDPALQSVVRDLHARIDKAIV